MKGVREGFGGLFIQMCGLSGSGKTTISNTVKNRLKRLDIRSEILDGDEYREGLCSDLGFSKEDRNINIRRLGFVGKILARNDIITIMAAINPYEEIRQELKKMGPFVKTVYVECDFDILKNRDPKGLYRKALLEDGHPDKIYNFTGVSDPFEIPECPDLIINSGEEDLKDSVDKLYNFILEQF